MVVAASCVPFACVSVAGNGRPSTEGLTRKVCQIGWNTPTAEVSHSTKRFVVGERDGQDKAKAADGVEAEQWALRNVSPFACPHIAGLTAVVCGVPSVVVSVP